MSNSSTSSATQFRWRTCNIQICAVAERFGPGGISGDTADALHAALVDLDRKLFPDAFGRDTINALSEEQTQEWLLLVLRAWEKGITEYCPEPNPPTATQGSRSVDGVAWILDFERYRHEKIARSNAIAERNELRFELAWAALRELNIPLVVVEFSGEGDSGQIDSIEPEIEDKSRISPVGREITEMVERFRAKDVLLPGNTSPVKLSSLIDKVSNYLLCQDLVPDWYNNDGGCGTLEWRTNPDGSNLLMATVNQRVTEYETTVITFDGLGKMVTQNHQQRT